MSGDNKNVRQLFREQLSQRQPHNQQQHHHLSPYARQDARTGHLFCTICRVVIKKASLWSAHELTEKHVSLLRTKVSPALTNTSSPKYDVACAESEAKTTAEEGEEEEERAEEISTLPSGFFDSESSLVLRQSDGQPSNAVLSAEDGGGIDELMEEFEKEIKQVDQIDSAALIETAKPVAAAAATNLTVESSTKKSNSTKESKVAQSESLDVEQAYIEKEAEEDEVEDSIRDRLQKLKRKIDVQKQKIHASSGASKPAKRQAEVPEPSSHDNDYSEDDIDETKSDDDWRMISGQ